MRVKYDKANAGSTTDNTAYSFRVTTRVNFVDISSRPSQVYGLTRFFDFTDNILWKNSDSDENCKVFFKI